VPTVGLLAGGEGDLPNTTFRDGIVESFVASPTYAGHLYLTYEEWDGAQFDVKFTQSTDGGATCPFRGGADLQGSWVGCVTRGRSA
jgi:hypothetical protein